MVLYMLKAMTLPLSELSGWVRTIKKFNVKAIFNSWLKIEFFELVRIHVWKLLKTLYLIKTWMKILILMPCWISSSKKTTRKRQEKMRFKAIWAETIYSTIKGTILWILMGRRKSRINPLEPDLEKSIQTWLLLTRQYLLQTIQQTNT